MPFSLKNFFISETLSTQVVSASLMTWLQIYIYLVTELIQRKSQLINSCCLGAGSTLNRVVIFNRILKLRDTLKGGSNHQLLEVCLGRNSPFIIFNFEATLSSTYFKTPLSIRPKFYKILFLIFFFPRKFLFL